MYNAILIALAILAAYRLTSLLSAEHGPFDVFVKLRNWAERYKVLDDLLSCQACLGVWCAALMALCVIIPYLRIIVVVLGIAGGQFALWLGLPNLEVIEDTDE